MSETRKRLPVSPSTTMEHWDQIVEAVKETGGDIALSRILQNAESKREWKESSDSAYFEGVTEQVITSLDEAIVFSRADMKVWEVKNWRFKTYDTPMKIRNDEVHPNDPKSKLVKHKSIKRTNYAVSVEFVRRDNTNELIQELFKAAPKPIKVKRIAGKRTGVVHLSDFHFGAEVKDLMKTKNFNIGVLKTYLDEIAKEVNSYAYQSVHLAMLGDFFESISGLNHKNSFKSLSRDGYGRSIIKLTSQILLEFMSKINNLDAVYMISGNHDRLTPESDVDNMGEAAAILFDYMELQVPDGVTMKYHPVLLSQAIDGINYLFTHGHYKLAAKSPEKLIMLYGDKDLYNVVVSGHLHTRITTKGSLRNNLKIEDVIVVSHDELPWRRIVAPSIFTGNFYSETLGYTTLGGFLLTYNNGRGVPVVIDIPI